MNKKRILLIVSIIIIAVVIGIGAIFGVRAYNNYILQQQIDGRTKDIETIYAEFEAATDREAKLKILSDLINVKPSTADEISPAVLEAVEPLYIETLTKMRQYFIGDYNTVINENTFLEADISEDRKKLLSAIDTLLALGKTVEDEKSMVFFSESTGAKDAAAQINSLITDYRLLFINDYNAVLKGNTFDDTEKIKDKDKLNKAIQNLSALKDLVVSEKEKIFDTSDDTYSELINTASNLISKYQTRIEDIETAEEEAKKATNNGLSSSLNDYYGSNNYNSDSNYNDSSDSSYYGGNTSGGSSNSDSNSSSGGGNWTSTWTNGDGKTSYYNDYTGEAWDDDGNTWNFLDIQRDN